ncbi:MAG: hypothetical protein ABIQ55_04825 [Gemmatimonadaceae bacterium]
MKLSSFWWLLIFSACSVNVPTDVPLPTGGHQVLFIGNSLTYTNDLPGTLSDLAKSVGDTIVAASVTNPDFAVIDHVNGLSNARVAITSRKWEFVILQQGPTTLPVNQDTLILATKIFDPIIKSSGGKTALFMVWPTSDHADLFPDVLQGVQLAADAVGGIVFPAGEAWKAALVADSRTPLYGSDGYHPAVLGTYLSALVFYEMITRHDARLLPARAVVSGQTLSTSTATVRQLQEIAHEVAARFIK